jgi:hypothetical protein
VFWCFKLPSSGGNVYEITIFMWDEKVKILESKIAINNSTNVGTHWTVHKCESVDYTRDWH